MARHAQCGASGYGVAVSDPAPLDDARDEAAAARAHLGLALRDLNDAVMRASADPDELQAVAARVEALAAELTTAAHRPRPLTFGAVRHDRHLVGGVAHPFAPQLALRESDGGVRGTVTLGPAFEGGPGLVHGGVLALLFDHAMGQAVLDAGHAAMTVSLEIRYHRPTQLDVPIEVAARLDEARGRKLTLTAETRVGGEVTAAATGIFLTLTRENLAQIFPQ